MNGDAAAAFVAALKSARYPQAVSKTQPWMRKVVAHDHAAPGNFWKCAYCGCDIGSSEMLHEHVGMELWAIDHLVPSVAGGPDLLDNKVSTCVACNSRKGVSDWLLTGTTKGNKDSRRLVGTAVDPERIRQARMKAMGVSLNHLVRDPLNEGWTKLKVGRVLAARWEYPRSVFFAACPPGEYGYLGLRQGMRTGDEVAAVLTGCEPVDCLQHQAWLVSRARWLDVVWQLIALNSLVLRLDLGEALPDATPDGNADAARWPETYRTISEVVYRRHHIVQDWSPKRPPPRRTEGEPPPRPPTRPGGKLPRKPNGTGWRVKRRERILADFKRRLEARPKYVPPSAWEKEQIATLGAERWDALLYAGMRIWLYGMQHDGKPMPPDEWQKCKPPRPRRKKQASTP